MKLTSAIRVTFALAAMTIGYGALAGPYDTCVEEYFDTVQPCVGPCAPTAPTCKIVHEWISYCEFGGGGCTLGDYAWYNSVHDLYHCAASPFGNPCICGTGTIIEVGVTPKWARNCTG